ncbi:alpha/beta hydrolase fold family protein [Burkholderia cenocepacia]|uniref:Alpha/beta hydrolase fold family protein n=1 Tax=Burkholderia cenocepacia TaxID=95486 RepID=A0AAN0RRQ1_9BURK|nr:alpha/beta hydrolase fold family protein [Burkholderia cenocepacia]
MTIWTDLLGAEVGYRGNTFRTRTIEAGWGEPLLLLHGVGGHAEAYARNVKRLGEHFHAIAVDFVWHGLSTKPLPVPKRLMETYANQLIDLMDSMDIERASIEGESLGGWVALYMALNHPDRLNKLILNTNAGVRFNPEKVKVDLAGGTHALRERSLAAIGNPTRETVRKRLEWLVASPDRVTEELLDTRYAIYNDPETQKALTGVFTNTFADGMPEMIDESRLSEIRCPTLVLWADKNPGVGEDGGRRIAELIPGAQYYCIYDAAHWPQWEKPEEHDRVVTEFLLGK